jgi:lipopolysaccharide/colanic/teichoic acid biosynthesis glycosyltransferase
VNPRHFSRTLSPLPVAESQGFVVLDEADFRQMIAVERKRTERSRKPVVLMLVDAGHDPFDGSPRVLANILSALSLATRDTDMTGWYKQDCVVGVMFTEINFEDRGVLIGTLMNRVSQALQDVLSIEKFSQVRISLHVYPEDWGQAASQGDPALYPDLLYREHTRRGALAVKRVTDIVGSLAAILIFSPLFLLAAAAVKFGSKGPILFKQERLGQFGNRFTFLKFRSMLVNNDVKIHREFMKRIISGEHDGEVTGESKVYKMTNDPRVTRVGRFLRRTSLDELPQFFNVLMGDMSLVGPRPPLAYECQEYDIWHRRRVLEVKPGITGLWQVKGRSRVSFDDMVRLDLQYVRMWSIWVDILILLKTPIAVLLGGDAF